MRSLLCWLCVLCWTGEAIGEETWLQWRGNQRDGTVADQTWPESLDETHLRLKWRTPAGQSYSGPIVDQERVYITETRNRKTEVVRALDRTTGEPVWEASWEGALEVPFFAKANGDWIRATPACDGERLYVAGMRDVLVCLDCRTGEVLWRYDFPTQSGTPLPSFGFVSSPLVVGDAVYVQAGGGFCKLDKKTGALQWNVLGDGGGMLGSAFASPFLWERGGNAELLVQTRSVLAAVDPADGTVRWQREIPAFRGMNILTPVTYQNSVITSSYGGATWRLAAVPEPGAANAGELQEVWKNKVEGYMSTPVVVGDFAYLHLKNQRLTCLHLPTGESRWTTRPFGKYWSLVTNGDKILGLDQDGTLYLLRANPQAYEQLAKRKLTDSETWAHLAVCGDELFVRDLQGLSVYEWSKP